MTLDDREKALIKESYELMKKLNDNLAVLRDLCIGASIDYVQAHSKYYLNMRAVIMRSDYE